MMVPQGSRRGGPELPVERGNTKARKNENTKKSRKTGFSGAGNFSVFFVLFVLSCFRVWFFVVRS
jgi:hypothetical protein